jgi:hypothetical protein
MPTSLQTIVYIPMTEKVLHYTPAIMDNVSIQTKPEGGVYLLYWKNGLNK